MKLVELFKLEPGFPEQRRKLRVALETGKITEETELLTALRLVFGSPDYIDSENTRAIIMTAKLRGPEFGIPGRNVREILWLLERVEREHEKKLQRESAKPAP